MSRFLRSAVKRGEISQIISSDFPKLLAIRHFGPAPDLLVLGFLADVATLLRLETRFRSEIRRLQGFFFLPPAKKALDVIPLSLCASGEDDANNPWFTRGEFRVALQLVPSGLS